MYGKVEVCKHLEYSVECGNGACCHNSLPHPAIHRLLHSFIFCSMVAALVALGGNRAMAQFCGPGPVGGPTYVCPNGTSSSPIMQASDGNLYSTTNGGPNGKGEVLNVSSFTSLYNFCSLANCADGSGPGGLIEGADGALYGATYGGGANGTGTIFKITLGGKLTTLYNICAAGSACPDGTGLSGFILSSDGNFYGTMNSGGANGKGTIFRMTPSGQVTPLYAFCSKASCADGSNPNTLLQTGDGKFWGLIGGGLFKFVPPNSVTAISLSCSSSDPTCGAVINTLAEGFDGNFYGLGPGIGNGSVVMVTPSGSVTDIFDFCGATDPSCNLGINPTALTLGDDGNFYGTTQSLGPQYGGTVFEVTPSGTPTQIEYFCDEAFYINPFNQGCPGGAGPDQPNSLMPLADGGFIGTTPVNSQTDDLGIPGGTIFGAGNNLPAALQISFPQAMVVAGTTTTLSWKVLNAPTVTMQQCYAFLTGGPGGGHWTGRQPGTYGSNIFSGSSSITPTKAGNYTYALTCGGIESARATLTVVPQLAVKTISLPSGVVGTAYLQTVMAMGGFTPYTWSLASGSLPPGLMLDPTTGNISGTPSAAGTWSFTAQAKDSESTPAFATMPLTITINRATPAVIVLPAMPTLSRQQGEYVDVKVIGVTTPAGTITPYGTVQLTSGSYNSGPVWLSGGETTIVIPIGALPVGADALSVSYTPTSYSAVTYNSAIGTAVVKVFPQPWMTITPAATQITTTESLTVAVALSGTPTNTGTQIPTGSVMLVSGRYASAPVALSGGMATITVPAGKFALGSNVFTVSYMPDAPSSSIFATTQGTSGVFVVKSVPQIVVMPTATTVSTAGILEVVVHVIGTPTPYGTAQLNAGAYNSKPVGLNTGRTTIVVPPGWLAAGTNTITVSYTPNSGSAPIWDWTTGTATVTAVKATPRVVVTPASTKITTKESLEVTVNVEYTVTPFGSVQLTGGGYTSAPVTLNSGRTTFVIPAGALATGTDKLTVSYTPNTGSARTYNTAQGSASVAVSQ